MPHQVAMDWLLRRYHMESNHGKTGSGTTTQDVLLYQGTEERGPQHPLSYFFENRRL